MIKRLRIAAFCGISCILFAPIASHAQYKQINLISDGAVPAAHTDPFLVNPWGIAASPTGPFWLANNGSGTSTIIGNGGSLERLVVTIPLPQSAVPAVGNPVPTSTPDGIVFNSFRTTSFTVSGQPSFFIFSAEDGTISAWAPGVNEFSPTLMVDNSVSGTVYKGLALGDTGVGTYIYATDFHNNKIDVFDSNFLPVSWSGAFVDPSLPTGFAPFGIQNFNGKLFVAYAKQQAPDNHDDEPGPGNGYVDVYDLNGNLLKRLVSQGALNSPWGMVMAPANFGSLSKALLVGNFGDGLINAFNPTTGAFIGSVNSTPGNPIQIGGLWGLAFGNGHSAGLKDRLYFTSGPNSEADGLFGVITRN